MSLPQVGYLVPLTETLEENPSILRVPISQGPNVIGRSSLSLPDKRLSRKHLILTALSDGSASLSVEGSNPVVVNIRGERNKIRGGESLEIGPGCVIELIPGHYFFKYEVSVRDSNNNGLTKYTQTVSSNCGKRPAQFEASCRKKGKQEADYQSSMQNSQDKTEVNVDEAIRSFNAPKGKLPQTFRLLKVRGLPAWANTSAVSIQDVIQGDVAVAILSNYMVDIDWLMPACPALAKVPHVVVLHGQSDGSLELMKRSKLSHWILHKPPLPISFGTHHSKAMLLIYRTGVRIVVHTANLIHVDWNNKSQGLWMQDFPWKDQSNLKKGCTFEDDLVDYLTSLKWPEFKVKIPCVGEFTINSSFFRKFNYEDANVRLIASVPGYHTGTSMKKWGHMKLRTVLQGCTFDKEFQNAPLIYQFSSLGSLDEKWMAEFASSLSSGVSEDKSHLGPGDPLIIWPTVEDVRCSLEGYGAGSAIPSPLKNVEKNFLKKYWAKWKANHTGRSRAMPHIKTFCRYKGQKLAWFLLTSSNLSKAAWGALQKNNSQLMIRSYELGVLFLPSTVRRRGPVFSCTDEGASLEAIDNASDPSSEVRSTKLVTLAYPRNTNSAMSEVIQLPVPYELPPKPYSTDGDTARKTCTVKFGHDRCLGSVEFETKTEDGKLFKIEIGYFDRVEEIKAKVERYRGIPASRQILVFCGKVLKDGWDVERCGLLDRSWVNLVVAPEPLSLTTQNQTSELDSAEPASMEEDGCNENGSSKN